MRFGVSLFNGLAVPWAQGTWPETTLARNPDLSGTARWDGTLLAFSGRDPLSGGVSLVVDVDGLSDPAHAHDLHFRDIAYVDDEAPSTRWFAVRSLDYEIRIEDNGFHNASGEGWVTGSFMGEAHEAMAGTLKRGDMRGAFGGTRE